MKRYTLTAREWEAWSHPDRATRLAARTEIDAGLFSSKDAAPDKGPAIYSPDGAFLGSSANRDYLRDEPPLPERAPDMHRDFVVEVEPGRYKVLRLNLRTRTLGSAWYRGEPRPALHPPTEQGARAALAGAHILTADDLPWMGLDVHWARPLAKLPKVIVRISDAIDQLGPARADTYAGPRWRYDRPLDGPRPAGWIIGADGSAPTFGHGTVDYPRQLRPFEVGDLVLLGQVVGGQLVGPVVDAIAETKVAAETVLEQLPTLDPRLRLTQVCRAFVAGMAPRALRDSVRLALDPGMPGGRPAASLRAEIAAWHAVKAIDAVLSMQFGAVDLDALLAEARAAAARAVETAMTAPTTAPIESPHVHRDGDKVYADSDFLRAVGALAGNEVRHLGMGEFTVETELGDVAFIRRDDAVTWPGKVGRAHLLSGTHEAIAGLLQQEAAAAATRAPSMAHPEGQAPHAQAEERAARRVSGLRAALAAAEPTAAGASTHGSSDERAARRARLQRFIRDNR